MGLSGHDWLTFGWLAAATMAGSDHLPHANGTRALLARLGMVQSPVEGGSCVQSAATEELAHAEMRAAGREFGLKASEAAELAPGSIRDRAAWWSESLRKAGINPRLAERFVTSFVTAAHEALREQLPTAAAPPERRRDHLRH